MELPAYFICDAHLGIDPPGCVPDRESKLVRQLESWEGKASHVVIVGDLFEFWYEYRYYVSSAHMELFRVLSELVRSGVQVHLLRGNHDFAYGDFFPKELGVQVHKELVLDIQGKRVYFRHGDGVPKSDRGYRFLRRVLDFPLNRRLFRMIHPDLGMAIARFVGRNSVGRQGPQEKGLRLLHCRAPSHRGYLECREWHRRIPGRVDKKSRHPPDGEWRDKARVRLGLLRFACSALFRSLHHLLAGVFAPDGAD